MTTEASDAGVGARPCPSQEEDQEDAVDRSRPVPGALIEAPMDVASSTPEAGDARSLASPVTLGERPRQGRDATAPSNQDHGAAKPRVKRNRPAPTRSAPAAVVPRRATPSGPIPPQRVSVQAPLPERRMRNERAQKQPWACLPRPLGPSGGSITPEPIPSPT